MVRLRIMMRSRGICSGGLDSKAVEMFYTKLALVTSAFYLGTSILLDGGIFGMSLWKGSFGVSTSKTSWAVFFGLVWLSSFLLSWRIVVSPLLAQIAKFRGSMHP
jgi:hypothetical protein